MSDNIYNILGKLNALAPKETPKTVEQKPVYESVAARGSVLEGVAAVESRLARMFAEEKANEDMLSKKDYDGDGKKESPKDEYMGSKDKAIKKAMDKKDLDEETHGQYLAQKEKEAEQSGKKSFQAFKQTHPVDGKPGVEEAEEEETEESLEEGWDDMLKAVKDRAGPQPSGGSGIKQGKRYGGGQQKDDEGDEEPAADNAPKKKGRPKKDKFAESELNEFNLGGIAKKVAGVAKGVTQGIGKAAKAINSPIGNANVRPNDNWLARYGRRVSDGQGFVKHYVDHRTGKVVYTPKPGTERMNESDSVDEAVRGTVFGKQGKGVVGEKAPPGAKAERMVKHIKKGYAKDGKVSDKEKSIAYATAWKAHNKGKLKESVLTESTLDKIAHQYSKEVKDFMSSGDLDDDLFSALYDYYFEDMPYGTKKARDGDPYEWVAGRFHQDMKMRGLREAEAAAPVAESGAFIPGRTVYWRGKAGEVDRVEGNKCFVHRPNGEMDVWPTRECSTEKQGMLDTLKKDVSSIGQGIKNFVMNKPEPMDEELNELAKLAGLSEAKKCNHTMEGEKCPVHGLKECGSMTEAKKPDYLDFDKDGDKEEPMKKALKDKEKVDECGPGTMSPMSSMGQDDGSLSINTSMNSDGTKSVSVNATGNQADALAQMLKMAGIGGHGHAEPKAVVIQAGPEEQVEEERDVEYANTPDEEVENVDTIMHQGNDLHREKEQYAGMAKLGDNPMATPTRESVEMPKRISRMLEGVKKVQGK
jgi:hypothetical protein